MQLQSIRIYIAMVAIGSIEHSLGKSGFEIELIEAQDFHSGVKTKRDSVPKHEKITFLFLLLIFGGDLEAWWIGGDWKDAKPLYLEEDFIRERAASHFIRIHQNSSTGGSMQ